MVKGMILCLNNFFFVVWCVLVCDWRVSLLSLECGIFYCFVISLVLMFWLCMLCLLKNFMVNGELNLVVIFLFVVNEMWFMCLMFELIMMLCILLVIRVVLILIVCWVLLYWMFIVVVEVLIGSFLASYVLWVTFIVCLLNCWM